MRELDVGQGELNGSRGAQNTPASTLVWTPALLKSLMLLKHISLGTVSRLTGLSRDSLQKWLTGSDSITLRSEAVVRMVLGIENDRLSPARVHVLAVGLRADDRSSMTAVAATLKQPKLWRLRGDHEPANPPRAKLYALQTQDDCQILINAYDRIWGGFNIGWIPGATWACGIEAASILTTNSDLVSLVDKIIPREDVAAELLNDAYLGLSKPLPAGASNMSLQQHLALAESVPY